MRTETPPAPARSDPDRRWRGLLHDLGHGLATVSYLADDMRTDPALSGTARHRLELMGRDLARLLDLVAGDPAPPEPVDVRVLLGQVAAARDCGSPVLALRPGEPVMLCTDPTLLWRMVSNLVDNAVRAAGPGGVVELAAADDAGAVRLEITDDGPGIGGGPAGTASMGLGIVTGLARACGGELHLDAAGPRGTCARLVFPRS